MNQEILLVATTAPDHECARKIAHALVSERLAACVNLMSACESVYRWQGEVQSDSEIPMLIKTTQLAYQALAARLLELHPYDTPELLAWAADHASPAYSAWVIASTIDAAG
ncbi:MAG: divalent-cation tolerance protein CutA [Quisquiliibacterium sp.]